MVGNQVNVFLAPADLKEVEARIRALGDVVFLAGRSKDFGLQVLADLRIEEMGTTPLVVYAARPSDMAAVVVRENLALGDRRIDVMRSPVVEIQRSFFDEDGGLLRRGRLYYVPTYFNDTGESVTKPRAFLEWAKGVLDSAVYGLQKWSGADYIGKAAASWKERNPDAKLTVL